MNEAVASPKAESPKENTQPTATKTDGVTQTPTEVEPPYSEYEGKKGKPYSVDYFDLGRYWNEGELYTKEIGTIETYIDHMVKTGEVNNTLDAVKAKMKKVEKMINLDKNDRRATRVAMVAAHFEFLSKAADIKRNSAKYSMV